MARCKALIGSTAVSVISSIARVNASHSSAPIDRPPGIRERQDKQAVEVNLVFMIQPCASFAAATAFAGMWARGLSPTQVA
jgi:hypothetical protein